MKKTTDFGACRDLYGRRLRHVNDEIRLKKWLEDKEREEESRGRCPVSYEGLDVDGCSMWIGGLIGSPRFCCAHRPEARQGEGAGEDPQRHRRLVPQVRSSARCIVGRSLRVARACVCARMVAIYI